MRVLQINTVCGYGSTGRSCIEIARTLEREGHECYIAYGQLSTDYSNSYKIGTVFENHFHNILSRLTGKQGYYSKRGTKRFIKYIEKIDPDVIHLHNLHGNYLNLEILFNYLAEADKPVLWSLHDCWSFTGKCAHYTDAGCYKWQSHCFECPQVRDYPPSLFFDFSEEMFKDKKRWLTSVKRMNICPVSDWLAGEVRSSFLSVYPVITLHNWIDNTIFRPTNTNVREKYGISKDKFVILGVNARWEQNGRKLRDFIRLSQYISGDMQIVLVGNKSGMVSIPDDFIHIPYLNDIKDLAEVYSMADVYVHLSTEDTFGKVIVEALSCGTPAIVYNSTACPEVVGERCGITVEKNNLEKVNEAISKIKEDGKSSYSTFCREHVLHKYNIDNNIGETIEVYKNLIN